MIKFTAFRGQRDPFTPYKLIITYTLEWSFTLIWLKKKHKKWEHPLSWIVIEDSNST